MDTKDKIDEKNAHFHFHQKMSIQSVKSEEPLYIYFNGQMSNLLSH